MSDDDIDDKVVNRTQPLGDLTQPLGDRKQPQEMDQPQFGDENRADQTVADDIIKMVDRQKDDADEKKQKLEKDFVDQTGCMDDSLRLYESFQSRREKMIAREGRLRKIIAALKDNGYSQQQVNQILNDEPSVELFDDLETYYNTHNLPPINLSDIGGPVDFK